MHVAVEQVLHCNFWFRYQIRSSLRSFSRYITAVLKVIKWFYNFCRNPVKKGLFGRGPCCSLKYKTYSRRIRTRIINAYDLAYRERTTDKGAVDPASPTRI